MNTTPYADPPHVLRDAAALEVLPDWYLALMLARLLNRKTPARSTEISRPAANLYGQGLKATAGGYGCGGGDGVVSRDADRMEVPPTTQ